MSTIREQQIGLLEVIGYLMAIIAVVGAVAWNWELLIALGLIVAAVPYVMWWEIQNLEQGNAPSRRARRTMAKEGSVSQGQTSGRPVTTETKHHGIDKVALPDLQNDPRTTTVIGLKGASHDSAECGQA
jgi:hypothetical protein